MAKLRLDKLHLDLNKHQTGLGTAEEHDPNGFMLADKVVVYCRQNGLETPYGVVFTDTHLGSKALANWSSDKCRAYFAAKLQETPPDEESVWRKPGTMAFQVAAANLLARDFVISPLNPSMLQLYRIMDHESRIVAPVEGAPTDVTTMLSRIVVQTLAAEGVAVTQPTLGALLTAFHATAPAVEPPKLLGQPGDLDWCLHRRDIEPDASVPYPNIQQFLDRLSDPAAYAAWWWGLASGLYKGRQAMWVHDHDGYGGKSAITKAMAQRLMGDTIYTSYTPGGKDNTNQFTTNHFRGKALVVVGDNKNSHLLQSGVAKELLGDDKMLFEMKFKQPFSGYLRCRILILSNPAPFILRQAHSTTRIIYLKLAKLAASTVLEDDYGAKCAAEMAGFLAYGERCYAARCVNDLIIEVNEQVKTDTALRVAECETQFASSFDDYLIADASGSFTYKEFVGICKELKMDPHRANDFLQWIKAVFKTEQHLLAPRSTGWFIEGVRLKLARDKRSSPSINDGQMPGCEDDAVYGREH